jgi:hypothetical protein
MPQSTVFCYYDITQLHHSLWHDAVPHAVEGFRSFVTWPCGMIATMLVASFVLVRASSVSSIADSTPNGRVTSLLHRADTRHHTAKGSTQHFTVHKGHIHQVMISVVQLVHTLSVQPALRQHMLSHAAYHIHVNCDNNCVTLCLSQ